MVRISFHFRDISICIVLYFLSQIKVAVSSDQISETQPFVYGSYYEF